MKTFANLTTLLLYFLSTLLSLSQQTLSESLFYSVSSSSPNALYQNDPLSNNWIMVGETGTNNLKALAYNNQNNILYGIDEGILGTINLQTGQFNTIGLVNSGEGAFGEVILDNVEALTFDPFSGLLFAIHHIPGEGEATNDLFFKIDPLTGFIVEDAVFDFKDRRFDYVPIAEISRDGISLKDILGITINPATYDLIALISQNGYSSIVKLDKRTGKIESVLYNSNSSFSDISYDASGKLYATIGNNNNTQSNTFVYINVEESTESILSNININSAANFQSLASTGVEMQILDNDLALRLSLSPDQKNPVKQGAIVSFDLTVFNQGELIVDEFRLSVEIDKDKLEVLNLGIDQSNWIRFGDRIYGSFHTMLNPGDNYTTSFEVQLNEDFNGMMNFTAEIFHAYNKNITNEIGKFIPLLDVDSNYDDLNNEVNIINDEINGGGTTVNEDEDDHDTASIEVQRANNLIFSPCYTVSSEANAPNVLFEFNPATEKWTEIGITEGTSIDAIATDPVNDLIYAVDGDTFGMISINSGIFTPYGKIGYGGGAYGIILLDKIKGLTYDPVNEILYGVHRIEGEGPGTNDVLFQIDVSTGRVIPVAMQDPSTGSPIDYVIIPEVFPPTDLLEFYDVDDIAYNPYTGELYAIHNKFGSATRGATISVLNQVNGTIEAVIYGMNDENDLEGMGFTSLGELYATQGDMGLTEEERNNFLQINLAFGETISFGKIDPDDGIPPAEQVDFEAFDCFTAYNDLALRMEVAPSIQQPIKAGDEITFIIEVFNQGDFTNNDISIVNYIPTGLILSDSGWEYLGNGTAIYTYNKSIESGTSFQVSISFMVDENFEEESITNTAEIVSSFNPQIVDPVGNPIPLPDWDSFPDDQNLEFVVTDNDINGGGLNSIRNKDEDDHDIAIVEIGEVIVTPQPYNTLTKFNCYAVSEDNAAPNVLFEFDAFSGKWTEVGVTGGTSIEAIATDPISGIIYATDAGQFGTIDAKTAVFNPIGLVGSGNGEKGLVELNDVDGLTYDPLNQIMYATHRVGGLGPGTNDLLFQIDVATGKVIPGAMLDANNNPGDYGIIPEIFDGDFGGDLYDVDDIAYSTYTGQLLAIQNTDGPGYITQLDPLNGQVLKVIFYPPYDDIEGLGFNSLGQLFGTTGDNGSTFTSSNALINIDLLWANTTPLNSIDPTNQYKDFEAFDCFTAYNDLALKIEVDENTEQPVLAGNSVDFIITIYNQGDFNSSDISLTNYIPNGLELTDALWTDTGDDKARYTITETLEPGATATAYISFKVVEGFEGQTLTNTVEISATFSPVIIDQEGNFFIHPMPDLDSQPDDENNETNVSDNEINAGGPNANQDEDDHDIAIIEIGEPIVIPPNTNPTYFPCYSVSEDNAPPNVLFEYNPSTQSWTEIGVTGGTNIEAIATDPLTDIIYATDNDTFGIIDANSALFTPIGEVGSGNGDMGTIDLNDVDGLTFDPVNQIMYATHRVRGQGPDTNDVLFQIDVATGQLIPKAMLDADNNPADYAIIPEVFDGSFAGEVYDVDDIAYNPYNGKLYAIQNQDGPGTITQLDPLTGEIIEVVYDTDKDDIEGLGFNYLGELYATTGDNGSACICDQNQFFHLNLKDGTTVLASFIDQTGKEVDFEAFDCFTAYNDLALKIEVDPSIQQPLKVGETVTFQITIYNQGDFNNSNITLTNYIPDGLELVDPAWTKLDNGKGIFTINETLEPGSTTTVYVSYNVVEGFEEQTLTNAVEITYSFSPDIIDLQGNRFTEPLPDLDSQPDDFNGNEINVSDNEIYGGGPNANQDEDDHDIATIEIGGTVVRPPYNLLTPFSCYAVSSDNGEPNVLFENEIDSPEWQGAVGVTGGTSIEAMATDPVARIIYAADAGTFGTIDAKTALFFPIGEVGTGNGDAGVIELNDVDGLTYDGVNQIMYATHRVGGTGIGTNDLLFQIDVATGKVIPAAMFNADNNPVDYAIIPNVNQATGDGKVYDVEDIAYNPYSSQLIAIHNQDATSTITQLDPLNGQVISVIIPSSNINLKGLGFGIFSYRYVFATTGSNGSTLGSNELVSIDLEQGEIYLSDLSDYIDLTNKNKNFEAFDCFTAYIDLALSVEATSQELFNTGSEVTFALTIYNQGVIQSTNITLTNYIPDGFILADNNWVETGDGKATFTFERTIKPGEDRTIPITFLIVPGFEGQTITNTAEISSFYDFSGNQTPAIDWDSKPDNENNETPVEDNQLNGGGPNARQNKDEDDHDISVIYVGPLPCPVNLLIPDGEISGYFQAQQEIDIQGEVKKTKTAVFDICE